MKQPGPKWVPLFYAAAFLAVFATQLAKAELLEKTRKVGGATVRYKVVLPGGYDPAKTYPAINVLTRNLRAEAEKRGYIVIAPAAPDDQLFFEDGARIFPGFLKLIQADYRIQDNKFHIAGPSNGGIAAFHVAAANPQYFLSVTVAKLQAISRMCVFMFVGEKDPYMWPEEMRKEAEWLRSEGTVARMETLAGANAGRVRRIRRSQEGLQQLIARRKQDGILRRIGNPPGPLSDIGHADLRPAGVILRFCFAPDFFFAVPRVRAHLRSRATLREQSDCLFGAGIE